MSQVNYPTEDRRLLEQIVSDPRFGAIIDLPVIAWQEVLMILGCYAVLLGCVAGYLSDLLPLWLTIPLSAFAIFVAFTPLHDASHRALSSNGTVNDILGTVSAFPLFPGFTSRLYRFLHMEHHQYTGIEHDDPDDVMVITPWPWKFFSLMFIDVYWVRWYLQRGSERTPAELRGFIITLIVAVGWHVAWLLSPYAWEFVLLWLIPQRLGIFILTYLFAYIQHPEGVVQHERPFQATRMYRGGWLSHIFMIHQSQHLIHHLFPAVPYYRYNRAWLVAEPWMRQREIVWSWPLGKLEQPGPLKDSEDQELKARIEKIEQVSAQVRAYTLAPAEDKSFQNYTAGAHIDVHVGSGLVRQYSLTHAPRPDGRYRIAVKREDKGRGGSKSVHEQFSVGSEIKIGIPRNHFPMSDHYRKVQLIAGGIGITPLLAMAQTLAAQGIDFDFHVCARNQEQLPFANELQQAGYRSQVQTHLDDGDQAQQLSAQSIPTYSKGQGLYLCGPQAFMNHVIGLAESRGWPLEAIHTESFVTGAVEMGNNRAFTVELSRSNKTLEIPAEKSLLTVLQENRIEAHGVCTQGLCGACRCKVIQGEVEHRDVVLSEREHQQGIMTPCVSRAAGERLVLDL